MPKPVIKLTSFGYLHLPHDTEGRPIPPQADRIEDVRDRLRDPAAARDILDLDGLDPRVQDVVRNTPGARVRRAAVRPGLPRGRRPAPAVIRLPAGSRWTQNV